MLQNVTQSLKNIVPKRIFLKVDLTPYNADDNNKIIIEERYRSSVPVQQFIAC